MSKLPPGWAITTISDITEYLSRGKQPKYASYSSLPVINQKAIRWFGIQNEYLKYIAPVQFDKWEPERFIQAGDILWNSTGTGTLGRACLVKQHDLEPPKVVDSHVTIVRPHRAAVESRFLFSWIQSSEVQEKIASLATGATNQIELSRATIASMRIPIAPLNEQKRIADKLDALLARVDACHDRLIRVSFIIQQFRQATITAGISRKITQNSRRKSTENSAYNHQKIVGKLSDFADVIDPNPSHRYPSYKGGTIPILATEQMSGLNDWDTSSAKLIKSDFYEARKTAHDFLNNDIIFARKGRLGLARNPPKNIRYVFSHTVFIIRVKADNILPSYLLWFLRQESCIDWLLSEMNSNAGVPTLGKSVMERLPVTIPDYAEQQEIVRYIEKLYAYANRIEARYQNALTRVEQLTPTLLSKAFRGELVPQDPNDEPVSVLLERIRAERAAQPNKPKRVVNRRKSNMTKISSQSLKKLIHQLPNNTFSFEELYSDINEKMSGDYDSIKDILFTLLDESEPSIIQIFDSETKAMRFMRRYQ
ncbi:restriction endonuclease subunit S [Coleofasciculus sp. F4-SAH-05]|uniref:restriction endonuclease subunit S n=1 Tax=Coleofasciculus sp. F4-SAH-05 TaxID=3069525 RepID=UPI0032F9C9D0